MYYFFFDLVDGPALCFFCDEEAAESGLWLRFGLLAGMNEEG
jgi:hypothetical protein